MSIHRQEAMDPDASNFLLEEGVVNSEYRLGLLAIQVGDEEQSVQVIPIARFNGRNLVAVPFQAWHKKVAKRVLPKEGLLKPNVIEVLVVEPEERDAVLDGIKMRLWVGFLSDELFDAVDLSLMEFDADYFFEVNGEAGYLPFAQSLMEVANEHYAFFSAGEEGLRGDGSPVEMANGGAGSDDMSSRMERMEIMMTHLHESFSQLMDKPRARKETPRVAFSPSTSFQPKAVGIPPPHPLQSGRPGALRKPSASSGALDPALVNAATLAGVGEETLEEVARLMSKNVKAQKVKDVTVGLQPDPLSETEEEEADHAPGEGSGLAAGVGDPMQQAVINLAEIMKSLTEDKKKKSSSKIETTLDFTGASSSEASTLTTGKRSAAARRALRQMLLDQPEELFNLLEKLMMEDLLSQTLAPGMPSHAVSSRAWVEHRSRIGAYRASAHCAWGVAGALDCLARGQVHAARARLNILLLQIDQSACDRGNWTLAAELSLEHPPPFSSLLQHSPPSEGEPPYSRLLDPRWGEIAMAYLREQDEFVTKRKVLGKSHKKDDTEEEKDSPRRKPKAKPKGKASSEGDA